MENTRQRKFEPLPTSYTENNQKEKEILFFAENYQRQFRYLYPNRAAPTLYLENECKINKLLCTTLCPMKITKTTELREWNDCAIFLADYLEYIPLNNPIACPKILFSLDSILRKRKGNCLEMSMILCTLLLSSDFNAYVVQGYATKEVTKKIETEKADPIFTLPRKFRRYEEFFAQRDEPITQQQKNKYYLDFERARKFWIEGIVSEEPEETKKEITFKERERDILFGKRVHFWVLILLSKNGMIQPVFLEASTGETISTDNSDYFGIEFVWNDRNFWSNNQKSEGSCKGITFDFEDYNTWEAFLPEYSIQEKKSGTSTMQIRMPETWIRDIEITQKDVENRFPSQGKEVRYKTSKVFKYNPHSLRDGLVFRINHYNNEDLSGLIKSHSFYSERGDSLEYRVLDLKDNTVTEMFAQNREDALKAHEYHLSDNTRNFQTMEFYSYLRLDRLSVRKWTEEITIDYFTNRSDFLSSRQVTYRSSSKSEDHQDEFPKQKPEQSRENVDLDDKEEKQKETEGVNANVINLQICAKETGTSKPWTFNPSSFNSFNRILENVDFSTWNLTEFLQSIDPAERYATSESDDEVTRKHDQHEQASTVYKKRISDEKHVAESSEIEEDGIANQEMPEEVASNSLLTEEQASTDDSDEKDLTVPEGKVSISLQTEEETRVKDINENGVIIPEKNSVHSISEENSDDSITEENSDDSIPEENLDDSISEENLDDFIPEGKVIINLQTEQDTHVKDIKGSGVIIPQNNSDDSIPKANSHDSIPDENSDDSFPEGKVTINLQTEQEAHVKDIKGNRMISPENSSDDSSPVENSDKSILEGKVTINLQTEDETHVKDIERNGGINPEKSSDDSIPKGNLVDPIAEENLNDSITEENLDDSIPEENLDDSISEGKVTINLKTGEETHVKDIEENGVIIPEKNSDDSIPKENSHDSISENSIPKENSDDSIPEESLDDFIPKENLDRSISEENSDDSDDKMSTIQTEESDEKNSGAESELDSEIYDDINFDALSDEELEIDYQIYLSKIREEYLQLQCHSLFYLDKEYENRKDMQKKEVLTAKKRIIKKRRVNVRYLERKETGKPSIRQYKRKSEEQLEQGKYTDALIKHLQLNVKLDIPETRKLEEFHVMDLDKDHIEAAEAEIIKKESMKLLDKSLKVAAETEALTSGKHISSIKHTYLKDASSPLENSIQNILFLFENNAYRIDFHRPEGRSTCRSIIFTRPEGGSTEFTFSDYLCRQIIPVYEKSKISRPRLYSYLVSLIKKESLVKRENAIFENDMNQLLAKRAEEMSVVSSFKERSGWKMAAQDVLEAKYM